MTARRRVATAKHCIKSTARSKPHRRIVHPDSFTLSVDLSGRMVPGRDQSRHECKYMMVALYTFPVTRAGNPLVEIVAPASDPLAPPEQGLGPASDMVDEEYTTTEPDGVDCGEVNLMAEEAHGGPGRMVTLAVLMLALWRRSI